MTLRSGLALTAAIFGVILWLSSPSAYASYGGRTGEVTWATLSFTDNGGAFFQASASVRTDRRTLASCDDSSGQLSCEFGAPRYSPDGTLLTFARYPAPEDLQFGRPGPGRLVVESADGTNQRELPPLTADDVSPAFLPGGQQLVFTGTDSSGHHDLFAVGINGTGLQRLTYGGAVLAAPCANGAIAFQHGNRIVLLARDHHTEHAMARGTQPDCAPSSRQIVFVRGRDLSLIGTDGRHLRRLTRLRSTPAAMDPQAGSPVLSPDGTRVGFIDAYDTAGGSQSTLKVIDFRGQTRRQRVLGGDYTQYGTINDQNFPGWTWRPLPQ